MDPSSPSKRSLPGDTESTRPRKIRRGTGSCWACKRRKVRCHYVSRSDRVCDGCKTRCIACVSQDYPEDSRKLDGNGQLHDRLSKVEALLDRLVNKVDESGDLDNVSTTLNDHSNVGANVSTQNSCLPLISLDSRRPGHGTTTTDCGILVSRHICC